LEYIARPENEVLRLSKLRTGQLIHRASCDFFKLLLQKTQRKNVTIINYLIQYQILSFKGYTIIPELKKNRHMGKLKLLRNEEVVRLSECQVDLLEIQVFHDVTL